MARRQVPIDEAIRRLRVDKADEVHTYMQARGAPILVGASHPRDGLIERMRVYGVEESGEVASAMGHTLAIVELPQEDGRTVPLFIEAAGPGQGVTVTLDELRACVATMKGEASEQVRLYGRIYGVDAAFVDRVVLALGEISLDEALTAIEREALAERQRAFAAMRE